MTISVRSAVDRLIQAHSDVRALPPLSDTHGEFTLEQAYAIQDALRAEQERRGQRPIGWKLGATSPSGQAVMGVKEPACGFLLPRQYAGAAEVSAGEFVKLGVEAEIAFRMRTKLVGPNVTADAAGRAVEGAVAALELPDFIFSGKPRDSGRARSRAGAWRPRHVRRDHEDAASQGRRHDSGQVCAPGLGQRHGGALS